MNSAANHVVTTDNGRVIQAQVPLDVMENKDDPVVLERELREPLLPTDDAASTVNTEFEFTSDPRRFR
jgi:hypothetical protein